MRHYTFQIIFINIIRKFDFQMTIHTKKYSIQKQSLEIDERPRFKTAHSQTHITKQTKTQNRPT